MRKIIIAAATAAALTFSAPAAAQNFPLMPGEYWEMTGIDVDDGAGVRYANWLATEWRQFNDFAKSQGWISDYLILTNVHNRKDEADFYLITKYASLPDAAESERRAAAFRQQAQRTDTQLASESGQRAQYRHVLNTQLLQEMKFRQ